MAVVHRVYARALFEAAREAGRLEEVATELGTLAQALEDVPELRTFLRNPQVDPPEKAATLGQIAAGMDELVRNFLKLIAEKGRAGELREMHTEFDALLAREQGRLAVRLTTAVELSEEDASMIVETIERVSGRTVEATRAVDPTLIGGIVLDIGSFRADGSVRGRLERLRHELVTAH